MSTTPSTPKKESNTGKETPMATPDVFIQKEKDSTKEVEEYFTNNKFQQLLENALNECFKAKSDNPTAFLV